MNEATRHTPDTELFTHFMIGIHAQIGKQHCQDWEIFVSLMLEIQKILEAIWKSAVESRDNLEICCAADTGSFFILEYCGILPGFETPKIALSDLKKNTLSPN